MSKADKFKKLNRHTEALSDRWRVIDCSQRHTSLPSKNGSTLYCSTESECVIVEKISHCEKK